jgi:hypothetical protein
VIVGASVRTRLSQGLLLDEDGLVWQSGDAALRKHFNSRLSQEALINYLITNIGWIAVGRTGDEVTIRCRPAFVTESARAALYYYIFDLTNCAVSVHLLGEQWQHFALRSRSTIIDLLEGVANGARTTRSSMIAFRTAPEASPLLASWKAISQLANKAPKLDDCAKALAMTVNSQRWSISHFDRHDHLIMDRRGAGFTPYNYMWSDDERPLPLEDYAGSEYADWIATTRRYVASSEIAVFDEVDSTLNFPRIGLTRMNYYRVTAAMQFADGQPYVLSMATAKACV